MSRFHTLLAQITGGDIPNLPKDPLNNDDVTLALRIIFGLAGAIALLIVTIGALKYVLSQGDPASAAKAKNTVLYGLIGLAVVVLAAAVVSFVTVSIR